jgi:hypothetical protein
MAFRMIVNERCSTLPFGARPPTSARSRPHTSEIFWLQTAHQPDTAIRCLPKRRAVRQARRSCGLRTGGPQHERVTRLPQHVIGRSRQTGLMSGLHEYSTKRLKPQSGAAT